jgi:ankyrin repeat protein
MRKWTIHHLYNQYLPTLWLAFLLLTSCNTGEMAPITLQANPGMAISDTAYFTKLLFEGAEDDENLNSLVRGKEGGAPVGASNEDGDTPLIVAIKSQNVEAVHYLIQQGADINQKNQKGYAPLHYAVRDIIDWSVEDWSLVGNLLSQTTIFNSQMPHILCSYRADVNVSDHEDNTPLHHAILQHAAHYNVPTENIQILLQAGAQLLPNNNGDTPLTLAKSIDRSDIVALLEKEGTIQSTVPSLGTLSKEKLVSYLLSPSNEAQKQEILHGQFYIDLAEKDNIHINTNFAGGNKLIHLATKAHNLSMIQFLLQYDSSQVNYTNLIGQTPLHIAAENGDLQVAEYLARYTNINLNALSRGGYSPLHYTLIHGHNRVVGCLVQSGANINMKDKEGKTCLHYAAYNGFSPAVYSLLQNGANINARDNYGDTPLHDAVRNGSLEVVQYLPQNGANINARNDAGETPLDIATENEQSNIVEYLIRQGAIGGSGQSDDDTIE